MVRIKRDGFWGCPNEATHDAQLVLRGEFPDFCNSDAIAKEAPNIATAAKELRKHFRKKLEKSTQANQVDWVWLARKIRQSKA